jgi:hypothetical protein
MKLDYEQKYRDYMAFFHRTSTMKYWVTEADKRVERLDRVIRQLSLCFMPVEARQNVNGNWVWTTFESAKSQSNTIRTHYQTHSLESIYNVLIDNYPVLERNPDTAIDINKLKLHLAQGKVFFTIDDKKIDSELNDFFIMSRFLASTEQSKFGTEDIAPYSKCRALFMVLHYMKRDTACMGLLNNMGLIMGSFNGMVSPEELLLSPSDKFASVREVKRLDHSFPSLVDMQSSYYKFVVLDTREEFISHGSRLLAMNKISYYDFAEQFDGVKNEYKNYLQSMIFTFKLLIPDQENFKLAKQVGFIDSNVIDWTFWRHNVILKAATVDHEFLVEHHYKALLKLKHSYFNFFSNLGSDYYKKLVHEPVALVFNIAAVIFAIAGVIQVLQQANIIPARSDN